MKLLIDPLKSAAKNFVEGWGKRQLLKLGLVVVPILGVEQGAWDGLAVVVVAAAIQGIEILASRLNK